MKKTETDQILISDAALDEELAQMAEEVPPMPANFHDRWMNAVKAEAAESASGTAEENPRENPVSLVRWTRILSVAAVFVFLIGGTILYRRAGKNMTASSVREELKTADTEAEARAAGPEAMSLTAGEPVYAGAAEMEAETEDASVPMMNLFKADTAEAPEAAAGSVAMEAAEMDEYAAEAPDGGMEEVYAAPMAAATAMPTVPVSEPEEEAEPEEAGPEDEPEQDAETPAEEGGFLRDAGAFFTDMGDFLLAALPYLAVLAVPAVIALVIRRRKKT